MSSQSISPIKENAILLKNIKRDMESLKNETVLLKAEIRALRDTINLKRDEMVIVKQAPTQSQVAIKNGWFW